MGLADMNTQEFYTGPRPAENPPPPISPYEAFDEDFLQLLALEGDQGAIAELVKRRQGGAAGTPTVVDIGGGFVGIKDPVSGEWIVREANTPGAGGGSSSFSSSEAGIRLQAQLEAQARAEAQAFQAQQAALDREEARRQYLLNSATQLARERMAERAEGRRQSIDLAGKDPFRLIASLQAKPAGEGPTPYDALKTQVRSVAEQNIPQIGPNATVADLESAVTKMQAMNTNVPAVPFTGMATGGQIAPGGPSFGGQGYSVMVGDRKMNGDEEIATMRPDGSVIITPLVGRAADGAALPQNASVIPQLNLTTLPESFQTLRDSMSGRLGITTTPSTQPARFGGGLGQIYGPLTLEKGLREALVPPEEAARLSNLIGQLPNPRNAANTFRYMNPAEKMAVLSAYQLAGIDPSTFDALVNSALIIGAPRRALSAAA